MSAAACRTAYTVSYNSENHWSVLTQMYGSQWPRVLPYCIANVILMIVLQIIDQKNKYLQHYIEVSSQGHTFITLVVAFLLVSRVNTALTRYTSARDSLGIMYNQTREIIQNVCVLTGLDSTPAARAWRHDVAYQTLVLLRTVMVVLDFPEDRIAPWDIPELNGMELLDVKSSIFLEENNNRRWAHKERTVWEESMRVPIRLSYLLRKTIHSQNTRLQQAMSTPQENKVLGDVSAFMIGYYSIRKFLTTVCLY